MVSRQKGAYPLILVAQFVGLLHETLKTKRLNQGWSLSRGHQLRNRLASDSTQFEAARTVSGRQNHILPGGRLAENGVAILRPWAQTRPDLCQNGLLQLRQQLDRSAQQPEETACGIAFLEPDPLHSGSHIDGMIHLGHDIDLHAEDRVLEWRRWLPERKDLPTCW